MFKVRDKQTGELLTVFAVTKNSKYIDFLLYRNGKWIWIDSIHYEPVEGNNDSQ